MKKELPEVIQRELSELGSSLPHFKEDPFSDVPEDFFEAFPTRVVKQIKLQDQKKPVRSFVIGLRHWAAMAASLLLLISLGLGFLLTERFSHSEEALADESLLADNWFHWLADIDPAQIYEPFGEGELSPEEILFNAADWEETDPFLSDYLAEVLAYYHLDPDTYFLGESIH